MTVLTNADLGLSGNHPSPLKMAAVVERLIASGKLSAYEMAELTNVAEYLRRIARAIDRERAKALAARDYYKRRSNEMFKSYLRAKLDYLCSPKSISMQSYSLC